MIDVLFITRLSSPENTEITEAYKDLRLTLNGKTARVEYLRYLASSLSSKEVMKPDSFANDNTLFPVLTPIHINEFLKKQNISMVEIPSLEDDFEKACAYLKEGVRIIALCTTWLTATNSAMQIRKAAKLLKSISPNTPLLIGGMGALKSLRVRELLQEQRLTGIFPQWAEEYSFTRRLLSGLLKRILAQHCLLIDGHADSSIDGIVLNDMGETTLRSIVDSLKAGKDFRDTPNLAIPEGNDYHFTGNVETGIDLDSQIIDWAGYVTSLNGKEAPIRRGTGCPYKCTFCDFQGLQKLRMRSPESMIAELKTLTKTGHRKVYFVDDNIAYTKKQLVDFTKAIISEQLNLSWRTFLRADTIDMETASLLKDSGCKEVLLGIESGDPQILINMNKGTDPEKALKAIQSLDSAGIRTESTFIVGFPGECSRSIENTASFISSLPSGDSARVFHRYYLFKFMVSPLSPIASPDLRKKFSLKGIAGNWSHNTMNSKEVINAMRELFLKVKGLSHVYTETFPDDWDNTNIRRVIELRDVVQKEKLQRHTAGNLEKLIAAVQSAQKMQ
jgi:p-methyltransferase